MERFSRHRSNSVDSTHSANRQAKILSPRPIVWLLLFSSVGAILVTTTLVQAQSDRNLQNQENELIQDFTLPKSPPQKPVYRPQPAPQRPPDAAPRRTQTAPAPVRPAPIRQQRTAPPPAVQPRPRRAAPPAVVEDTTSPPRRSTRSELGSTSDVADTAPLGQYILEFNRSPVVGNRFRLQGVYSEARLGFTRPRNWQVQSAKALIRFQHSPALLANRSNLTVRVNGNSVGSVPLNRKQSQVGSALFNVPPSLLQPFNEISVVAQQNNANCTDPTDQTLWTEILPDSKLIFDFQPQAIPLDFSSYPYPFFDDRALDATQIAYLLPSQMNDAWMTAAARFQAALGRLANFRPVETSLLKNINQVEANERLVIIGTPSEQPDLRRLKLPFAIGGNQVLDGNRTPLPEDIGVLMVTTTKEGGVPVLVATGNGPDGVAKAVQFLAQPKNRKLATGQGMLVTKLTEEPTPSPRQWQGYLPEGKSFQLSDLRGNNDKPFEDVSVRGSSAPPIEFDFRALPDDRFKRGSSMTLRYSYGPQVNPRTSAVQVFVDNIFIGGARLTSESGESNKTLNVNLPENLIKPTSKIQVFFRLNPRELANRCGGLVPDQQLTGTVHADTSFNLNRETSVQLPDLKLLQAGFPFAAPQDLSQTGIVLPDTPSDADLLTLMEFSERLGRLSKADSVKLKVYTAGSLAEDERRQLNLVAIGTRERFPLPEVLESEGFQLSGIFSRQWRQNQVQTLPDEEGVIKEVISPWNSDRVVLALTAQTETGLERVQQTFSSDPLFFQLQEDTALISTSNQDPNIYDPDAYSLEFLQRSQQRRIENTSLLSKVSRLLQEQWFLLPVGIVGLALLLYGIAQLYLKRLTPQDKK